MVNSLQKDAGIEWHHLIGGIRSFSLTVRTAHPPNSSIQNATLDLPRNWSRDISHLVFRRMRCVDPCWHRQDRVTSRVSHCAHVREWWMASHRVAHAHERRMLRDGYCGTSLFAFTMQRVCLFCSRTVMTSSFLLMPRYVGYIHT